MEGDEKRNGETVAERGDEKAKDNEGPQQPIIVLKRIPRKKKDSESSAANQDLAFPLAVKGSHPVDAHLDPDRRKGPEEAVEQSDSRREQFIEPPAEHGDTAPSEGETLEHATMAIVENVKDVDDQSDSSLEREFLYRPKKVPKKRKYVLTLQKYRGKKRRKPKLEMPDEKSQIDEVEEAMPRLESRVKMLSEVASPKLAPKAKRRPEHVQKVQFINSVLKQNVLDTPAEKERKTTDPEHGVQEGENDDNAQAQEQVQEKEQVQEDQQQQQQDQEQQGTAEETPDNQSPPHSMNKSKEMTVLMEATPAMKDVTSILESKPSPFDRGIKLRGRKLKKRINGKFYRGEVADYDRRNRKYKIHFDDGDEETIMWKDLEPMLVTFDEMSRWDNPEPDRDDEVNGNGEGKKRKKKKQQEAKLPRLRPQPRKRPGRN